MLRSLAALRSNHNAAYVEVPSDGSFDSQSLEPSGLKIYHHLALCLIHGQLVKSSSSLMRFFFLVSWTVGTEVVIYLVFHHQVNHQLFWIGSERKFCCQRSPLSHSLAFERGWRETLHRFCHAWVEQSACQTIHFPHSFGLMVSQLILSAVMKFCRLE